MLPRLAAAARRFVAAAPWRLVDDRYVFGLSDAARFGAAIVLGAAEVEFGLDVKLGDVGFALLDRLHEAELDEATFVAKSDGLTFSISDAAPASRAFERLRPFLLAKEKVRAGARRGYLTGWRLLPGRVLRPLEEEDALFLARCL